VELKRCLGLVVLVGGVLLMLTGLESIDSASQAVGANGDRLTILYILGGALLARIGAFLNPVGWNSLSD
jgi:hypothetical protein